MTNSVTEAPPIVGRGMTLSDVVARHARIRPGGEFLVDQDRRFTYRQTHDRVTRLANLFTEQGISAGDRVAVIAPNCTEFLEALIASVRLGAIAVPINFRLVPPEIEYILADSGARAVVTTTELVATLSVSVPVTTIGTEYEAAIAQARPEYHEVQVADDTPGYIVYTSGTTGRPKGAVLTHRNLALHALFQIADLGVRNDDRVSLVGTPLFHIAALSGMMPTIVVGGRLVLSPSTAFDPAAILDLLEREKITYCFFVPAQWQMICAAPGIEKRDLSALRRVAWGAAPASDDLLRTILRLFPQADMFTGFGQTETSPVTAELSGEDSIRKLGSVGKPMVGVEVRIVDHNVNDVSVGEVGEIVYRGPTVFSGYWNNPDATVASFTDGWFHSGDLARYDDEGFIYIVDRKKDMIISGGENIYSAEVERVLVTHPAIADVAIVGKADDRWGEVPVAVVVPADPASPPYQDQIAEFARERLAAYKCPRETVIVDALPRNLTGKLLKHLLRESVSATVAAS